MTIADDLARILETVRRPGDFCATGVAAILAPALEVEGVGPISLPLSAEQAERLVAVAEAAPYGRGELTLVDVEVRRAWQIDAAKAHIYGRGWESTLAGIVARVAEGLGVADPVTASLYKLLVYEEGGFFVSHRDTEKTEGMFATLVIVLPSLFTGGELVIRHLGREVRVDLRSPDPSEAAFAAFYADCRHEVAPVTSGRRLTLIYNLSRAGKGPALLPPTHRLEMEQITDALRRWAADLDRDDSGYASLDESSDDDLEDDDLDEDLDRDRAENSVPVKLIYPLEHAYTPAGLSFAALKGADAARASTLASAAGEAGCDVLLALIAIEESGAAEYVGHSRWRRRGSDDGDDDFVAVEVFDRMRTVAEWRRADGGDAGLGALPLEDAEVSPPGALDVLVPDEQSFHEATGNEGASFERSYRRAALVVWPSRRLLAVLNQGGLAATLPYLVDLCARWVAAGEDANASVRREAHELAGLMIAKWPRSPRRHGEGQPTDAAVLLSSLARLGDTKRIEDFLSRVSTVGGLEDRDAEGVALALGSLDSARVAALVGRILAGSVEARLSSGAAILARVSEAAASGAVALDPADLRGAAATLLNALPGDPARGPARDPWVRPVTMASTTAIDILAALDPIGDDLGLAAVDLFLAWPGTWPLDRVLIPALLALTAAPRRGSSGLTRLAAACRAHLIERSALPLAPPADWARESKLICGCEHCADLTVFLADPLRETWVFRAAQPLRSHVETTIVNSHVDLHRATLKRGVPHSLVCTKTQASYDARVLQRQSDLRILALLAERIDAGLSS